MYNVSTCYPSNGVVYSINYSPVVGTTAGTLTAANSITRLKPQGAKTGAHVRQLTNQIALGHVTTQPRVCM